MRLGRGFTLLLLFAGALAAATPKKTESLSGRIVSIDAESHALTILPRASRSETASASAEIRVRWDDQTKLLWSAEAERQPSDRRSRLTAQGGAVQPPGVPRGSSGLRTEEEKPAVAADLALKMEVRVKAWRNEKGELLAQRIELEALPAAASPTPSPASAERK